MATDYLPARESDLALWTANFAALITATPTVYGLTSGQATAYVTTDSVWQSALATATDPATRTLPAVAAKDVAKANVITVTRQYANVVQSFPSITDDQLGDLGLTIRNTTRPPVPPPATFPIVAPVTAVGGVLTMRISDQNTPDARRRPDGVIGCEVYASIGTTAPVSLASYRYQGLVTRQPATVAYDVDDATKKAWLLGRWITRKGQVGPWSSVSQIVLG